MSIRLVCLSLLLSTFYSFGMEGGKKFDWSKVKVDELAMMREVASVKSDEKTQEAKDLEAARSGLSKISLVDSWRRRLRVSKIFADDN